VERLKQISNNTLLGATGEISDFQALTQLLDRLMYSINIHSCIAKSDILCKMKKVVETKMGKFELNLLGSLFVSC
jgi:20S proteasome alpha/beta subunit